LILNNEYKPFIKVILQRILQNIQLLDIKYLYYCSTTI